MPNKKKRLSLLIVVVALLVMAWVVYRTLLPSGPNLDPVSNQVRDRSANSQNEDVAVNPLKEAYFGDLHVHSRLSWDAYLGGGFVGPDEAYRFAQGDPLIILGQKAQIKRPLDFAAVTDHAEFLGEMISVQEKKIKGHRSLAARYIRSVPGDTLKALELFKRSRKSSDGGKRKHMNFFAGFQTVKNAWDIHISAAEKHYKPGKFTTLMGYEWSLGSNLAHLHRNVIFRDMMVPDYPLSALELKTPYSLWSYLKKLESEGSRAIAIPHNSNLSVGKMFLKPEEDGTAADLEALQLQSTYEPAIEIHQAKGNSEVSAAFWPNDEFSDFENHDYDAPFKNNYVRYGLTKGLEIENNTGVNPYQYGLIASTDTHSGTPGNTEEDDDFISNHGTADLDPKTRSERNWLLSSNREGTATKIFEALNPGGLVGVWAPSNTRENIWDALHNKETFATSGGRIKVRFFGGWNFGEDHNEYNRMVEEGYSGGVPMGGTLYPNEAETLHGPHFLVWASKDPDGANLERIQVIKGWIEDGQRRERIYNAVIAENIEGASVNLETGQSTANKGEAVLQTVWTDPDFDINENAYYYLRVLELPTARWSLWDKIKYDVEYPEEATMIIRERAWSSPIWYKPTR